MKTQATIKEALEVNCKKKKKIMNKYIIRKYFPNDNFFLLMQLQLFVES